MKKVLVTGGSGFLGGHIVQECCRRGMLVTVLDKIKPLYYNRAEFLAADLTKPLSNMGLGTCKFDYVFHAAGELGSHTTFKRIKSTFNVNINGMLNLLDWIASEPTHPENDFESEEVYAHTKPHIINCGLIRDWLNPYMISKHTASKLGQMYREYFGLKFLDCRMTVVYGPRQGWKEEKVVPMFILDALRNKPLRIFGDGSSLMNMMYVKDVVRLLVDLIQEEDLFGVKSPVLIDIANPDGDISVIEFADLITGIIDSKSEYKYQNMRIGQPGSVQNIYSLSILSHHIEDISSYFRPLDEGLQETIKWYESLL